MHAAMKLGRRPTHAQAHRLALARFAAKALPPPPDEWLRPDGCVFPLFANDRYADCTIAGLAHQLHMQSVIEGRPIQFSEQEIVDFYFAMTAGADDGLVIVDVLQRAQQQGFPLSGAHRLTASAFIEPSDGDNLRSACAVFGGLAVGVMLPLAAQSQQVWDVPDTEDLSSLDGAWGVGSWGGHEVLVSGFDREGLRLVTWGVEKRATWAWWAAYAEEAHALLDADRASQAGVDFAALQAEIRSITPSTPPVPPGQP